MTGSLGWLVLAMLVFIGIHVVPATGLRGAITARIGERAYSGLFSLLSLLALAWAIMAYVEMPPADRAYYWDAGQWGRYVALVLVALGFVFLIAGATVTNPTAVGAEAALQSEEPAQGVLRITRHPMMWGIGLWGITHLLNNADPASIVLFGGMTVLAFGGTMLIDARRRRAVPDDWARYTAVTSNLPFAAILAGRNRLALGEFWWRALIGLVIYAALLHFHAAFFGASPLPWN